MSADIYDKLVRENLERWENLQADYDPITGEGVARLTGEERCVLKIKDFPVPIQQVPKQMMENPLIKEICKCGSITNYIRLHKKHFPSGELYEEEVIRMVRRVRHKHDFTNWAFWCINIDLKGGGRGRFRLNYAQFQVLKVCEELRLSNVPINIVIDKARQWGGSTFCIFYQFWIMVKWDEYHSFAIAAHVQDASHTILNMLKGAVEDYPAWDFGLADDESLHFAPWGSNKHAFVIKDSTDRQVFPGRIFIGSAEKPDTLRSNNIAGAHYSEVGVWPNTPEKRPEDLIADISGGMSKQRPFCMQVFESTAKSSDDYFHDICMDAYRGLSSSRCIFIPFFFIPHDTLKVKDTHTFAKWVYDHRNDDFCSDGWKSPGKYYWWLWEQGASFEAINWYRYEELNFTKRSQIVNEAPASLEESFQSAGQKVFDFFDVDRMMKKTTDPLLTGELISDAHEGEEVIHNIRFISQTGGKLKIWEEPDDSPISDRYVVAVDIGGPNPTSDYSSVRVLDRLMMMEEFGLAGRPNIVAEMHYHTDHDKLAYDAVRLAAWYNNALLVIESNTLETRDKERDTGGDGFEYILDIVSDIYPNLYARKNKEEDFGDKTQRKWGFHTNAYTKPKIIDHMRACLRDSLWYEPCKNCCEEMSMYIDDHGKFTAPPKKHDDELMATAILLWVGFKEMPTPQWIRRQERKKEERHGRHSDIVNL